MSQPLPNKVPCPACKKPVPFNRDNPYRPFCCHRCKLLDLGAWADGSYRIPTEERVSPESNELGHDDNS
jgi:uncharacterized protein